jgi:GT2 family glycosyltransferase
LKSSPTITAVVISRNEGKELGLTVQNLDDTLPAGSEIMVVDDGSTDQSADQLKLKRGRIRLRQVKDYGVARARNLGARLGKGEILVFADAHIRLPEGWWKPLAEMVENPKVGGAAPAINHYRPGAQTGYGLRFKDPSLEVGWLLNRAGPPFPAAILPGCCFAMRRGVFEDTGGWDERLLRRGGVDNEGCVRFWLLGYDLMVAPEVLVRHKFREASPYPVGWSGFVYNRLRLAFAHFKPERLGKVIAAQTKLHSFGQAMLLLTASGIQEHRLALWKRRKRSDDWYFERFRMEW